MNAKNFIETNINVKIKEFNHDDELRAIVFEQDNKTFLEKLTLLMQLYVTVYLH